MKEITLHNVLPKVFSGQEPESDIWLRPLTFHKGQTYLLRSTSGAGKSSFCGYIYGHRDDYEGQIFFDNKDISQFSPRQTAEIRRRHLSILFQELRLFEELTTYENIKIKNDISSHKTEDEINQLIERLGLIDRRDTPIGQMSYGQRQRAAFIRALCQPFDFILLDEPVSHLDEANAELMAQILTEETELSGAGIITTTVGSTLPLDYDKTFDL